MGRAGFELHLLRWAIRLAFLCMPLLVLPFPTEAAPEGRACETEPTDEVINYGDLITCAISPVGDSDIFRFLGQPNERVIIQTVKTGGSFFFNPCMELFGPNGPITTVCGRIDIVLTQAGTHTIVIRDDDNGEGGPYNLILERVFPLARFGSPIKYGETLAGQTIDPVGDLDFIFFSGATGNRISITSAKTGGSFFFNPCMELFGPNGVRISTACGRIDATLTQDGTHTLLFRDDDNGETGPFTVTLQCIIGSCTDAIPTALEATVSPPNLVVPVGTAALADATITNTGAVVADAEGDTAADPIPQDALSCGIVQLPGAPPAQFSYQAQNVGQLIGSPNTPVNILPGANQSFRISLIPTAAFCPTDVKFGFSCSNASSAKVLTGVNTLLLTAGTPTCGLSTSVNVSQPTFAVNQTLIAGGSVTNPGLAGTAADFYVGVLRPDNSIQFITSTGFVVGSAADLASFRPIAVNVPLGTPFSVSQPAVFSQQRTAGDPSGSYVFFIAAVKTGALIGSTVASDQILSVSTAPFSFP